MRLRDRVGDILRDQQLVEAGERVAVAVSGGLDSVCLLDLLVRLRGRHKAALEVVTVDHGTRPDSPADADFVEELAAKHGLACRRFVLSLGPRASEAECRAGRLACFEQLDVDRVAVGHHRDDQAETVLLALMRGSGSRGLSGMGWQRGRLVRPLLSTSRDELRAYAAKWTLAWRDDPTNGDPRYERNALRLRVLPTIEDIRPGAAGALAHSAIIAAEESAYLEIAARQALPGSVWPPELVAAPPSILIRRRLLQLFPAMSARELDGVQKAIRRGNGTVHLSGGGSVSISSGTVQAIAPLPRA